MFAKNWKCVVSLAVLAVFLTAVQAQAVIITWGPATNLTADSDVSTEGTLLYAEAGLATTVNTVPFTLKTGTNITGLGNSKNQGSNPTGLSTAYRNLILNQWWDTTDPISLTNLVSGTPYLVQMWASETRYGGQTGDIAGGPSLQLGSGNGQYAIGTFVADGTSQDIGYSGPSGGLNTAVQVRVIPEPATLALLAFGGLGVLLKRRRRYS